MPNISLRKKRTPNPRNTGKSRKSRLRKRKPTGLSHKEQRSLAMDAVDEFDNVMDLLYASPMFQELALLVREVNEGVPPEKRDRIARIAKEHFDCDIDKLVEQPYELEVVNEIPLALAASARWRAARVRKALYCGLQR